MTRDIAPGALLAHIVAWSVASGASFVFIRGAQDGLGPLVMLDLALWAGVAVAALAAAVARDRPRRLPPGAARRLGLLSLVTTAAPYPLIAWAQPRVSAATTMVVVATMPLMGVALARVRPPFERVGRAAAAGLALGLGGVAVIAGQPGGATAAGVAALASATALFAAGFVLAKTLCGTVEGHSSLSLAVRHLLVAAVVLTPPAAAEALAGDQRVTAENVLYTAGLGVVGYAYSYVMYYLVLRRTAIAHAALVSYLQPVAGVVLAWALLGEALGAAHAVGIALILTAVAIVDRAQRRVAVAPG